MTERKTKQTKSKPVYAENDMRLIVAKAQEDGISAHSALKQAGLMIQFELSAKPSKADKKAKGQSGFVPVAARWVIERSNAWVDRCKSLYPIKRKDF